MVKRLLLSAIVGVVCYGAAAGLGGFLIYRFSSNTHDKEVEAAMTGAFVLGPIGGLIGAGVAFVKLPRKVRR